MKTVVLAVVVLLAGAQAHAAGLFNDARDVRLLGVPSGMTVQKMVTFSNDRDSDKAAFSVMIDKNGNVAGFYRADMKNASDDNVMSLREVETTEGATMIEGQGHKVVLVAGKLKRDTNEGRFQMRYLSNGLTNTYTVCDFLLKKDDKGWYVQNAYTNRRVTSAKITTWSLGLTTIEGICQK
jgi:hypothetical protein